MFIRKRKSNLSLERAIYKPAQKDAQGNVIQLAVRTTEYLGSVSAGGRFAEVSSTLLEKLTDVEKNELRSALAANEISPDFWLSQLDALIRKAADDISVCVGRCESADVGTKKRLELKVKAINDAWYHFVRTAQSHGLKRRSRRLVKADLPQSDVG